MLMTQSISRARVTNLKVDYGELDCPCHDRLGPFSLYPIPSTLKKVSVFAYYSPEAQKLICRDREPCFMDYRYEVYVSYHAIMFCMEENGKLALRKL